MNFKIKQKYILFLFVIFSIAFFCATTNKIFAADLEVQYPTLANGTNIDSNSNLPQYAKYIFDLGIFIGFFSVFLSLIWAGVTYLMSAGRPDVMADAKERVGGAISGLLILITLVLIVTTINPQLSIFNLTPLEKIKDPPPPPPPAGAKFYKSTDCSGDAQNNTSSVPDFGANLTNKINSVKITADNSSAYISVIYDIKNFWGKCYFINSNAGCSKIDPFTASASVQQFDFKPSGDGVYFYRKPSFNKKNDPKGSYLKISNSQIENKGSNVVYLGNLSQLKFTGDSSNGDCTVPKDEQDCIHYDNKGKCDKRSCPNLANENIASIEIKGNYLVLLVYKSPSDNASGPWSACQAFPTINDVNKTGPNQIKWEFIRNSGKLPNYIIIVPVKQN